MSDIASLCHSIWECKYHIVWIPRYRRKALCGGIRQRLGEVFHELSRQRECKILEGHLMADHVQVLIAVPPKYAVAQVVGYLNGKSAVHIARTFGGRKRNFTGEHFWARGCFVSTVGRGEQVIREYSRKQEAEDRRFEQMKLLD